MPWLFCCCHGNLAWPSLACSADAQGERQCLAFTQISIPVLSPPFRLTGHHCQSLPAGPKCWNAELWQGETTWHNTKNRPRENIATFDPLLPEVMSVFVAVLLPTAGVFLWRGELDTLQSTYCSFATWNYSVYKNLARCLVCDSLMRAHAKIGKKN